MPKNIYEMAAWLILKLGNAGIFLILLTVVYWNNERRSDAMTTVLKENVVAFQQVSADLASHRQQSATGIERMKDSVSAILTELQEIRRTKTN